MINLIKKYKRIIESMSRNALTFNKDSGELDDLIQECLISLWRNRTKSDYRSFMVTCIKRDIVDYLRRTNLKGYRRNANEQPIKTELKNFTNDVMVIGGMKMEYNNFDKLAQKINSTYDYYKNQFISAALDTLTDRERGIVHHYYYKEITMKEIGLIYNVNESAISLRLKTINKKLRDYGRVSC